MTEKDNLTDQDDVIDLEFGDVLDLHAFHPSEAEAATRLFLQYAYARKIKVVRIIHGKGIGVQREMVKRVLNETPFVRTFSGAKEFGGNHGATIAELYWD